MTSSLCICGSDVYKRLFVSGAFSVVACSTCGQVRTITPKQVTRTQEYSKKDIAVYLDKEVMFRGLFRQILLFIKRFKKSGVFLEIGAGVGLLVDEAKNAGFEAFGIEPSKTAVIAASKHFGVNLIWGRFSMSRFHTKADVIVINHVLEHVPDPIRMIEQARGVLQPWGILIIGIPNFGSFLARAKASRWQSLIPDQHRWHFSKQTIDQLIIPRGFRRVGITSNNHDRSMHPLWKRPLYAILDTISRAAANGEAILVAYQKTS